MTAMATQDVFVRSRIEEVERINEQVRRLTGDLSEEQLHWSPPGGGWSIAHVFEHLIVAHSMYLERMRSAIEHAAERGVGGAGEWRPSLVGRFLIPAVGPEATRKTPAPRIWRPESQPRPKVVEEFLRTQEELRELLQTAEGLDLNRVRTSSPVSRLIRLNLGDCFMVLTAHAQRHLRQVERIRARAGLPSPTG